MQRDVLTRAQCWALATDVAISNCTKSSNFFSRRREIRGACNALMTDSAWTNNLHIIWTWLTRSVNRNTLQFKVAILMTRHSTYRVFSVKLANVLSSQMTRYDYPPHPFLLSFLLPSWRAVRSNRSHLEEWDPIWGDDWSHSPFILRSPSWGFLGFSSAVRQMPGDLCTAPRIISLSPLSLATGVTDTTLGANGLWLGTRTGTGGPATLS